VDEIPLTEILQAFGPPIPMPISIAASAVAEAMAAEAVELIAINMLEAVDMPVVVGMLILMPITELDAMAMLVVPGSCSRRLEGPDFAFSWRAIESEGLVWLLSLKSLGFQSCSDHVCARLNIWARQVRTAQRRYEQIIAWHAATSTCLAYPAKYT